MIKQNTERAVFCVGILQLRAYLIVQYSLPQLCRVRLDN